MYITFIYHSIPKVQIPYKTIYHHQTIKFRDVFPVCFQFVSHFHNINIFRLTVDWRYTPEIRLLMTAFVTMRNVTRCTCRRFPYVSNSFPKCFPLPYCWKRQVSCIDGYFGSTTGILVQTAELNAEVEHSMSANVYQIIITALTDITYKIESSPRYYIVLMYNPSVHHRNLN